MQLPWSINIVDKIDGIVSCFLKAHEEFWNAEAGLAALKNELCVMGESEF